MKLYLDTERLILVIIEQDEDGTITEVSLATRPTLPSAWSEKTMLKESK